MSSKPICEYEAKLLLSYWLTRVPTINSSIQLSTSATPALPRVAQILFDEEFKQTTGLAEFPAWTRKSGIKLVTKPDQLIKRQGKAGLLAHNKTIDEMMAWIGDRAGKVQKVKVVSGLLMSFILEPFLPHPSNTEYYVCTNSSREGDSILFTHEGGVDVGDVDAKALKLDIPVPTSAKPNMFPSKEIIVSTLLTHVPAEKKNALVDFLIRLYSVYVDLHFVYLEVSPLICLGASESKSGKPRAFVDKSGPLLATSAFTTASVIYSDVIAACRFAYELTNYGEYSGAPTEGQTYEYAKTLIDLITRGTPHPEGKNLIIGGGIANFTNVVATFKGIIHVLKEYKQQLINSGVKIFVRRGGPNYQEGLKAMRLLGESLRVPIGIFGPETHRDRVSCSQHQCEDTLTKECSYNCLPQVTSDVTSELVAVIAGERLSPSASTICGPTPANSIRPDLPALSLLPTTD
ncbi:related to ATP citrate lyase subunit 2 [Armillaria ostoyae]|uniref:ATP citrate synthase n=1 Tax=Armillaria ostoyae TaxID=47428 RepID=A0A284RK75_ARMOS|nr:related to ATP citrate lyase subunit 2 [Armillaria ostoyae]